jgi:hypothetical protein
VSISDAPSVTKFLTELDAYNTILINTKEIIENSFNSAATYAKHFSEFKSVFLFGKEWDVQKYAENRPDLEQFAAELAKFTKWSQNMER